MSEWEKNPRDSHSTLILPQSAPEHARLDLQSRALNRMMHDQPFHAPLVHPERILEVGCGTGVMTAYLAAAYPNAKDVIGVDLSEVPQTHRDDRVTFVQGDIFKLVKDPDSLAFAPNSFDYLYSRMLVCGMTDWRGYIAQAKELVKPGGWVELQELEAIFYDHDRQRIDEDWTWHKDIFAGARKVGLEMDVGRKLEGYLKDAGFVDVESRFYRWMYGKWPGHPETDLIGEYSLKHCLPIIDLTYDKVAAPNKTADEAEMGRQTIREHMSIIERGTHQGFHAAWGRKP